MSRIKPLPLRQSLALAVLTLEAAASVEKPTHGGHTPVQRELLGAAYTIKGAMRTNETSQQQGERAPATVKR